jgi:AraC-like DNA-binding protein
LSDKEKENVMECFRKINDELQQAIDKHSKRLIVSNLELLLNYCVRFYDRQFITRDEINSSVLTKFEFMLNTYFESDKPHVIGIPTVAYFAGQFNLSANYFGDLIKKETGKTALEYIQLSIIETAKEKIFEKGQSMNEIAHMLGFKYPQHFSRLFKQKVGMSPMAFRKLN